MKHGTLGDFVGNHDSEILPELKERDQWMCWYFMRDDEGKLRKKPYPEPSCSNYYERGVAKYTDSENWRSYSGAKAVRSMYDEVDGIGFVLQEDDDFVVLDIDGCIESNELTPKCKNLVEDANSYTEISPSGFGLHIIMRGEIPLQGWTNEFGGFRVEIYDKFFITITENHLQNTPQKACKRQSFLNQLFSDYHISWPDPKFTSYWP